MSLIIFFFFFFFFCIGLSKDNYDLKRVYAISLAGRNAGHVVAIIDLEGLPGINQYSDFEDLSIGRCPYQQTGATGNQVDCIWVGDVGNNAEWSKGTFLYVFEEPVLPDSVHNSMNPSPLQSMKPKAPITFRLNYEGYEYFKGPNIEALTVAGDGSKFWAFHKTLSNEGEGPASVWESEEFVTLMNGADSSNSNRLEDQCERDGNRTWHCLLSDKPGFAMRSNPYDGAEILLQSNIPSSLTVRSDFGERERINDNGDDGLVVPLRLKRIGKLRNPKPSCPTCGASAKLKNIRNISAADLSADGMRLLLATYGGIFMYDLDSPFDLSSLFGNDADADQKKPKQLTKTNRDGSPMTGGGKFWAGQEGVAFDYSFPGSSQQNGVGVWSVSEHHKRLYYLKCLD